MDRIISQFPEFFTWNNMVLLAESAGLTLAMTLLGCLIGFGLALVLVYLRTTPGLWALPLRLVCIAYVEVFRRIPFLVVIYLVLFFIQTVSTDVSLFTIAVISICIYAIAYTADIIRGGIESVPRTQVEAAQTMNLSRFQTMRLCVLPQAMPVIICTTSSIAVRFSYGPLRKPLREDTIRDGYRAFSTSGAKPILARDWSRKFSTKTSAVSSKRCSAALPASVFRSSVTLFLPRLTLVKYALSPF